MSVSWQIELDKWWDIFVALVALRDWWYYLLMPLYSAFGHSATLVDMPHKMFCSVNSTKGGSLSMSSGKLLSRRTFWAKIMKINRCQNMIQVIPLMLATAIHASNLQLLERRDTHRSINAQKSLLNCCFGSLLKMFSIPKKTRILEDLYETLTHHFCWVTFLQDVFFGNKQIYNRKNVDMHKVNHFFRSLRNTSCLGFPGPQDGGHHRT